MKARYSGDLSHEFWDRVNSVKSHADHSALYALGVALQNLEEQVLRRLNGPRCDCEECVPEAYPRPSHTEAS